MQVQLEKLTSSLQSMTEDLRQQIVANATISDDDISPLKDGFARQEGFALRPTLASSGAPPHLGVSGTRGLGACLTQHEGFALPALHPTLVPPKR